MGTRMACSKEDGDAIYQVVLKEAQLTPYPLNQNVYCLLHWRNTTKEKGQHVVIVEPSRSFEEKYQVMVARVIRRK